MEKNNLWEHGLERVDDTGVGFIITACNGQEIFLTDRIIAEMAQIVSERKEK